ncbi:MAG: hypothetical protein AAF513_10185 [Pseudomonadota bacterium]
MTVRVSTWQEAFNMVNLLPNIEQSRLISALLRKKGSNLETENYIQTQRVVPTASRQTLYQSILTLMQEVQPYAKTSGAAVYLNQLLYKMLEWDKQYPEDPILEVLFALYDALSVHGFSYSGEQFEAARELLARLNQPHLFEDISEEAITDAIVTLEDIGFDTLPYTITVLSDEEM